MKVVTNQQHYYDIAEVIRAKTGITTPLKPAEMAPALAAMTPADALPHAEEFTFGANLALPVIPASVLATHPKAVIFMVTSQESTQFVYIAAASTFYRVAGELLGMEYDEIVGSLGEGVKASDSGTGTWGDQFPVTAGTAGLMIGTEGSSTYSLVWANHDIYEVLDIDAATGSITTGAVYFAASNTTVTGTAEDYRIQKNSLDGFGEEVNRLCNTVEPMTPERMAEKLQNLDITLEELIVTPSKEVQEIRPGAYGFSKVIVEAVEDSGTGGGGTPGEGGEGETTTLPSANSASFGNIAVTKETPTGNGFYGDYEGALPALPWEDVKKRMPSTNYQYTVIYQYLGDLYCVFCDILPKAQNYTTYGNKLYVGIWCLIYRCINGAWVYQRMGGSNGDSPNKFQYFATLHWGNCAIMDYDNSTSTYFENTSYEDEVEITTVYEPVEYEASYEIEGKTINDLVTMTQQITGNAGTMTPAQAAIALEEYYKSLNPESTE